MRASTEKLKFLWRGLGRERGGDGWPHLKHQKPKKLRKTCIRASDIESQTHSCEDLRFFSLVFLLSLSLLFFFGSSEIFDAGVRFFLLLLLFNQGLER